MKNLILLLFLVVFTNNKLSAQDQNLFIQALSVIQTNENEIKANLKVYSPDLATFNSNTTEINGNIITLKVCYNSYFIPAVSNLENDFLINLPATNGNYTFKVEVYRANPGACSYLPNYLEDNAVLNFTTPFSGIISLSTNDLDSKNKNLNIYPNPVKDILYFSEEVSNVKIIDLSGKTVKQISASGQSVNVSTLAKGVYIINAVAKSGKTLNKKIIKE